jgi:hypothetical protein
MLQLWWIVFFYSLLGGFCYKAGSHGYPFTKAYKTTGAPFVTLCMLCLLGLKVSWIAWVLTFAWMFGSLTTDCKIGNTPGVQWYEWILSGLNKGFSCAFIALYTGNWNGLWWIVVFLTLFMFISGFINRKEMDILRGAVFVTTASFLI